MSENRLCCFLADFALTAGFKVACVDADIGQSRIGPPTTVGMKSFAPDEKTELPLDERQPKPKPICHNEQNQVENRIVFDGTADRIYFVGDVSSRGHFLGLLTGTRLMVDSTRETGADFVVIDTTGYILEQITACYHQQEWLNIHYLLPHRSVRQKSSRTRRRYRNDQFGTYFSGSSIQELRFEQIRGGRTPFFIGRVANEKELEILSQLSETEVYYAEWGHRTLCLIAAEHLSKATFTHIKNYLSLTHVTAEVPAYFKRRLIGLINNAGNTYAIGVIEAVDFQKRELSICCKTDAVRQACVIQFGAYQLK